MLTNTTWSRCRTISVINIRCHSSCTVSPARRTYVFSVSRKITDNTTVTWSARCPKDSRRSRRLNRLGRLPIRHSPAQERTLWSFSSKFTVIIQRTMCVTSYFLPHPQSTTHETLFIPSLIPAAVFFLISVQYNVTSSIVCQGKCTFICSAEGRIWFRKLPSRHFPFSQLPLCRGFPAFFLPSPNEFGRR